MPKTKTNQPKTKTNQPKTKTNQPKTFKAKGAGGSVFELTMPTRGSRQAELLGEKLQKGELVLLDDDGNSIEFDPAMLDELGVVIGDPLAPIEAQEPANDDPADGEEAEADDDVADGEEAEADDDVASADDGEAAEPEAEAAAETPPE